MSGLTVMRAAGCFTALAVASLLVLAPTDPAAASDRLLVGKPSAIDFYFSILDIGMRAGIFKKYDLDIEAIALDGTGKLHQALIANSVDLGLGAGTDLAFIAKGAPEKAVANMAGAPANMYVLVAQNAGVKTVDDLKGKTMGVSTQGSLTYWLAVQLSRRQGWGDNGFQIVTAGNVQAEAAAFVSGNLAAAVASLEAGLTMQDKGQGRLFLSFGDFIKTFMVHTIYATDTLMTKNPAVLRRFLKAWFESVAYTKSHKDDAIRFSHDITRLPPEAAGKVFDVEMPTFSDDGRFDPKAIAVVVQSLVEMGQLDKIPDATTLYTEEFLN